MRDLIIKYMFDSRRDENNYKKFINSQFFFLLNPQKQKWCKEISKENFAHIPSTGPTKQMDLPEHN